MTVPCRNPPGGLPCLSPVAPAFTFFLPPSPRPPSRREGGDSKFILPGATAPGTPAFDRLRHLQTLPCRYPGTESLAAQAEPEKQAPGGGLPPALPADTAAVMFAWGACLFGRLPPLPLAFFVAPIPPTPFPAGEGGDQGYFMQGASPLASPALNRLRHRLNLRSRYPAGDCPRRCRLPLSCRCPAAEAGRCWDGVSPAPGGGLPPALPADPALQGVRRLNPGGTELTLEQRSRVALPERVGSVKDKFKKSSWGFGGFFQEAPNAPPPQRSPPTRLLFPQRITAPGGSHARAPSAPVRIRAGEPVCGAGSRYTHPPSVRDGS